MVGFTNTMTFSSRNLKREATLKRKQNSRQLNEGEIWGRSRCNWFESTDKRCGDSDSRRPLKSSFLSFCFFRVFFLISHDHISSLSGLIFFLRECLGNRCVVEKNWGEGMDFYHFFRLKKNWEVKIANMATFDFLYFSLMDRFWGKEFI